MSANQRNSPRKFKIFAAVQSMEYNDINKDGIMDVVFTFKANEVCQGGSHDLVALHASQLPPCD